MSWLLGRRKNAEDSPPSGIGNPASEAGGDSSGVGDRGGRLASGEDGSSKSRAGSGDTPVRMDAYRFDSAALERAARAAKELESSS